MTLQVEMLERSFAQLRPHLDELGASFYQTLFSRYPEAKPLFASTDISQQQKKLAASLVLVVDNLRNPDTLVDALQGLGAKHVGYGTQPEHYSLVGEILLTTFADYLGPDWTPELEQVWADAYTAITNLMLVGAGQVN